MKRHWAALYAMFAVGLGVFGAREASAVPQTTLPDARLTLFSSGPPGAEITEFFTFDAANQEFAADLARTLGDLDVRFTGLGKPDPSIAYELHVKNTAAGPRELRLFFRMPIAPLVEADTVSATLDVDLVDFNGGGVSLTRVADPVRGALPLQENVALIERTPPVAVPLGVPLGNQDLFSPGSFAFAAPPRPGPSAEPFGGEFSSLELRAQFVLSPGDEVTLNGQVTMVPEPSGGVAGLVAATLLAAARRRSALPAGRVNAG